MSEQAVIDARLAALEASVAALSAEVEVLRRSAGAKYLPLDVAARIYGFKLETLKYYVHRLRLFTKHYQGRGRGHIVLSVAELDRYRDAPRGSKGHARLRVVKV